MKTILTFILITCLLFGSFAQGTVAKLPSDTSICFNSLPFVVKGNLYQNTEYPMWNISTGTGTLFFISKDSSTANFLFGSSGTFYISYKIFNRSSGLFSVDTMKVKVDLAGSPQILAPVAGGGTYYMCNNQVNLMGLPNQNGKNWWQILSGQGTIASDSLPNALLNMQNSGPTVARYYYKNGICSPNFAEITIKPVNSITNPVVYLNGKLVSFSQDTLCLSGLYELTTNPLTNLETGTWSIVSGSSVQLDVNPSNPKQRLTLLTTGTSTLSYEIQSVLSCPSEKIQFQLAVNDVPRGEIIEGNNTLCEGTDTLYKIKIVNFSNTLPVTYTWASESTNALLTGQKTGPYSKFKFNSSINGTLTRATISATPSNYCGIGNKILKTVTVKTAPRSITDTIQGPSIFSANNNSVMYGHNDGQNTGYALKWYWDEMFVGTGSDIVLTQASHWDNQASSFHTIKVELTNECTVFASSLGVIVPSLSKPIAVFPSSPLEIPFEESHISEMITVFPNPSLNGTFYIDNLTDLKITDIVDIRGNSVRYDVNKTFSNLEIHISSAKKEIYYMMVEDKSRISRIKLVF